MSLALISQSYLVERDAETCEDDEVKNDEVPNEANNDNQNHGQEGDISSRPDGMTEEYDQSESLLQLKTALDEAKVELDSKMECGSQSPSTSSDPGSNDIGFEGEKVQQLKEPRLRYSKTFSRGKEQSHHVNEMYGSQLTHDGRKQYLAHKQRKKECRATRLRRPIPIINEVTPLATNWNMGSSNSILYAYRVKHGVIKESRFKCDQCGYASKFKANLDRHLRTMHAKTETGHSWKCSQCPATFNSRTSAKFHETYLHKRDATVGRTVLECRACGKEFINIYSLAVHVYNHNRELPLRCLVCSYTSRFWNNAARHLRTAHGERKTISALKLFGSGNSSKIFKNLPWQNVYKKIRPCKVVLTRCDNLLRLKPKNETGVNRFAKIKIEDNIQGNKEPSQPQRLGSGRIYKCPYCFQPFAEAVKLIAHLPTHSVQTDYSRTSNKAILLTSGGTSKPFCCRYCQYSCKTLQRLQIHMKHHQKGGKGFRCSLCICYFHTFKAMRIHMGHLHKKGKQSSSKSLPQ